jgi:hypothetical protein
VNLVALHVAVIHHLLRGHAEGIHERGNAVVGKVPGEVLPREGNTGILPIKLNAPQHDPAPIEFLTNGGHSMLLGSLEHEVFFGSYSTPEGCDPRTRPSQIGHICAEILHQL